MMTTKIKTVNVNNTNRICFRFLGKNSNNPNKMAEYSKFEDDEEIASYLEEIGKAFQRVDQAVARIEGLAEADGKTQGKFRK